MCWANNQGWNCFKTGGVELFEKEMACELDSITFT